MNSRFSILLFVALAAGARADTIEPPRNHDFGTLYELQQRRTPPHDRLWLDMSNSLALSATPAVGYSLYGWAAGDRAALHDGAELGGSWLLTFGLTMALKWIVDRPRPYATYPSDLVCLQPLSDPSFPSGHTSLCFATATSLSLMYPKWYVAVPAFAWAVGVGYSRMYVGAHYPSDVMSGAVLGIGCAVAAHCVRQCIMRQHPEIAPMSGAVMLPLTFVF